VLPLPKKPASASTSILVKAPAPVQQQPAAVLVKTPVQDRDGSNAPRLNVNQRAVISKPKLYFSAFKNAPTASVHFFCPLDTINVDTSLDPHS
jgi:hypothetical protein